MSFSIKETHVLRQLAGRCREIDASERNQALKKRWTALNDLRHEGPPLLLVSPEGAWREIGAGFRIECEDLQARSWEFRLRQRIYTHDVIRDDSAVDAVFTTEVPVQESDFGIAFRQTESTERYGAYHDEPVLTDIDRDFEKLRFREITVNRAEADRLQALAQDTFGDLLHVRRCGGFWWTCGLTWMAIRLLGLEPLMLKMVDDPQGLHRLMRFLSDEMLHYITFFEREGLLDGYVGGDMIGSGSLGFTDALPSAGQVADGPVKLNQVWGFAESQETVGVSPEMFGEFIYPYQLPLLARFGLNYYGCCEASEGRWEYIRQTPNLRCISVAPWSDQARCAERFGRNYVYCRKPNPAPVCVNFNEHEIRREFQETLRYAGTLNTALILKDTHTVENKPDRFARWVQIGREILDG